MNRTFLLLLSIITYLPGAGVHAQDIAADHIPRTVILKVKPAYRNLCGINQINDIRINSFFDQIGVEKLEKKFPSHRPPEQLKNINGELYADLSTIYELTYKMDFQLSKVLKYLNNLPEIAYAEPHYIPKPLFTPNDVTLSYHLGLIQAYAAWDSTFGDTNIVIGITDSGTDTDHVDLQGNIKYNYADPIDGVDNDFDGFIDNYRGWDLGENDNDPSTTSSHHGIYVAGLAAAVTNNGEGVAGIGFNCKFLPIKVNNSAGDFTAAYEGIVYAADHGCQIINCSWGGIYKASQFEQDVITYASINKNALVIAAAGNDGNEDVFNPASLKYVLSIGGTDASDLKTEGQFGSTYGINLDLCAPGVGTSSTNINGNYITFGNPGTSWAAPVVSGCAAIVKSVFPNYSSIQIGEQLKVTSDIIDTIAGNSAYMGKLGAGRVNLFRAITETDKPSIVITRNIITDGNDDKFEIGETINVSATFKNYLDTTNNLFVTITSNNTNINILNNTVYLGVINTLDTTDNHSTPFTFTIEATANYNEVIDLTFNYSDGTYNAVEYIDIVVNSDMVDIEINDISSTITSESRFGYNGLNPQHGLGFRYKGEQLLYEAGFMVGALKKDTIYVSDNVLDSLSPDSDFTSTSIAVALTSPIISDFDVAVAMNDNNADSNMMKIGLEQNVYAWDNVANNNFIITEYEIINNDTITMNNVYTGIFADWDVRDYSANRASEESFNEVGYVTCTETGSPFVGVKLLSGGPFIHYAIDNYAGAPGVNIFSSSYTTSKKYTTLSTQRSNAGLVGNGNDVCDVVSTGPFTILPADTLLVAFALIAGDDFMDLLLAAQAAQTQYDSIYYVEDTTSSYIDKQAYDKLKVYPNPANNSVSLIIGPEYGKNIMIKLYNNMGVQVYSGHLNKGPKRINKKLDTSTLSSGLYHYIVSSNKNNNQGKLLIIH